MFENLDIKFNSQMLSIISEIDEFKGSWKLWQQMSPEKLQALKKVATIESVGSSNRIEGNKLSDKQVEELLSRINKQSFANRDEEEVAGYAKLADTIFEDWEVIPLSENYIKQLHKILLEYSLKDEKHKGEYKKISNAVAAYDNDGKELGIVFETATLFETPLKMQELVEWTNKNLKDRFYHPLIVIGIFVVNFLAIHPFQDGNGRLSRAITNLLLLKAGYKYIPYSSKVISNMRIERCTNGWKSGFDVDLFDKKYLFIIGGKCLVEKVYGVKTDKRAGTQSEIVNLETNANYLGPKVDEVYLGQNIIKLNNDNLLIAGSGGDIQIFKQWGK